MKPNVRSTLVLVDTILATFADEAPEDYDALADAIRVRLNQRDPRASPAPLPVHVTVVGKSSKR